MSSKKSGKPQHANLRLLGQRIRSARGQRSQGWLANILGVDKGRVSEWERGEAEARASTIIRISDVTGCDLAWLLRGDEASPGGSVTGARVQDVAPVYDRIPVDLRGDDRLSKAIDELVDVLRGAERAEVDALLKNIEVFARDARARLGRRRRRRVG